MQEILTYSISSVILSGGFYAIFRAFLQGERAFALNRWILLGLVSLGIALPALSFTDLFSVEEETLPAPRKSLTMIVGQSLRGAAPFGRKNEPLIVVPHKRVETTPKSFNQIKSVPAAQPVKKEFPYATITLIIYVVGLLALLTRFLIGINRVKHLRKRGTIERYRNFNICDVDEPIAPFSFWDTIYLPAGAYTEVEKRQIILHELAHISQKHSLDLILLEIACAMGWFNPFLRLFKKSAIELHEYLADSATLSAGISKIDYSSTLYKNLTGEKLFASSHYLNKDQIKRRLKMMSKTANRKFSALKYALVIPVVALIGLVFSCSQETASHSSEMQAELYATIKDPGFAKSHIVKFPGGNKALKEYLLSNSAIKEISKQSDNSIEILARFIVSNDGKVKYIAETLTSENNDKNLTKKNGLHGQITELVKNMPNLIVENKESANNEIEVSLRVSFGKIARNAFEASMKQPQPDAFPEYPGSFKAMEKFIASRAYMPKEAAEKKINAKVHVYFYVEPDGSITEPMVKSYKIDDKNWEQGELYGCDKAALKAVKEMPKWKPAMKDGKPIRHAVSVPIMFGDENIWNAKNQNYIQFEPIPGTKVENASIAVYADRLEFEYNKITSFINDNVNYPLSQIPGNISGVVLLSFELNNKGEFVKPKIERGINKAFDDEALRVVKMLKPVKPLTDKDGKPMGCRITTTVKFEL